MTEGQVELIAGVLVGLLGLIVGLILAVWQARQSAKLATRALEARSYGKTASWIFDVWEDINVVLSLESKMGDYNSWEPEEKKSAANVCITFHQLGDLIEDGSVDEKLIDIYYYSIPKCREILNPYLNSMRDPHNANYRSPQYFWYFDQIVIKAEERNAAAKRTINCPRLTDSLLVSGRSAAQE